MNRNGQLLRTIRGVTGLSRAELARRCGLSVETLKKIESGRGDGSEGTWKKIESNVHEFDLFLSEHLCGKTSEALIDANDCGFVSDELSLYVHRSRSGSLFLCPAKYGDPSLGSSLFGRLYPRNVSQYVSVLKKQLEVIGS